MERLVLETGNPRAITGLGECVEKNSLGFSKWRSPAECWKCGTAACEVC